MRHFNGLRYWRVSVWGVLVAVLPVLAHDPLLDLPDPRSVGEAWNVVHAALGNIQTLLDCHQLPDVAFQVSICSPAIRTLQQRAEGRADAAELRSELQGMFGAGGDLIVATRERQGAREKGSISFAAYRRRWERIERYYRPQELNAVVYICPMHPLERSLEASDRCPKCGMGLIRRRIPASSVYEAPGAGSMKLTVLGGAPLAAGRRADVRLRLARNDGTPVRPGDLLVMHTQRIHLLINDRTLTDYHHEHPAPTEVPGEYVFSFTPLRGGPYRMWADVVPAATSVQEYVVADILGSSDGGPPAKVLSNSAVLDGLKFTLEIESGGAEVRAEETYLGRVTVTEAATGKAFTGLEPVMGAFAHLVGFNEDERTVVHIHPAMADPTRAEERGGPVLPFRLYVPTEGYYRLYCQVGVGGKMIFPVFGVEVASAKPDVRNPTVELRNVGR